MFVSYFPVLSTVLDSNGVDYRYSAVRCQFGPVEGGPEQPVIEYQLQQWRLFPYLAALYVLDHFSKTFFMNFVELRVGLMMGTEDQRQVGHKAKPSHNCCD